MAHPGHELRAFGWASHARPLTFVLTKGDGHGGASRLESTSRVLDDLGAEPGAIYGRFSDPDIYELILRQRHDVLLALRQELADAFVSAGTTIVACDAEEWYNPSHDVCRYLTRGAARVAEIETGRPIAVFDFPLIGHPDTCPEALRDAAIRLELDDDLLERKLGHARRYPELKPEVERAIEANGAEAFRIECLRPAVEDYRAPASTPFYEQYGDRQVLAGHYREVIRFDPHLRGIREALELVAERV